MANGGEHKREEGRGRERARERERESKRERERQRAHGVTVLTFFSHVPNECHQESAFHEAISLT